MARMRTKLAVAASVVAAAVGLWLASARHLPALGGRPPQVALFDLAKLRAEFDAGAGHTRVLALLSPT
jgi:hypothetical protein